MSKKDTIQKLVDCLPGFQEEAVRRYLEGRVPEGGKDDVFTEAADALAKEISKDYTAWFLKFVVAELHGGAEQIAKRREDDEDLLDEKPDPPTFYSM